MSEVGKHYSLAVPVTCFFAVNPDEELTVSDVMDKFSDHCSGDPGNISYAMTTLCKRGWLVKARSDTDRRVLVYRIGPALLKLIGRE